MVELISDVLSTCFVLIFFSYMFFKSMIYCQEQLKRKNNSEINDFGLKTSEIVFFNSLYYFCMHLFVLSVPLIINYTWICVSVIGVGIDNIVLLLESFSIISWYGYIVWFSLFILYLLIMLLERLGIIVNKFGGRWNK